MKIHFHTSCAGIAGDPYKLLVAEVKEENIRETELYNTWAFFNLSYWAARRKLIRRIKKQVVEI